MKTRWFDDFDVRSCYLAAEAYGVKVAKFRNARPDEADVVFEGPAAALAELAEDFESGDVRPMSGVRELDDDAYAEWLEAEIAKTAA